MSARGPSPVPAAHQTVAVSTLHLRIGALDSGSTAMLRTILDKARKPGAHIVADLRHTDDSHDLTLFALLASAGRVVAVSGALTAVSPSLRLGHLLRAAGIAVTRDLPPLLALTVLESLSVGILAEPENVSGVVSSAQTA